MFEARSARLDDEADSSDSDTTFIYEPNTPGQQERSARVLHSSTPSSSAYSERPAAQPGRRSSLRSAINRCPTRRVGPAPLPRPTPPTLHTPSIDNHPLRPSPYQTSTVNYRPLSETLGYPQHSRRPTLEPPSPAPNFREPVISKAEEVQRLPVIEDASPSCAPVDNVEATPCAKSPFDSDPFGGIYGLYGPSPSQAPQMAQSSACGQAEEHGNYACEVDTSETREAFPAHDSPSRMDMLESLVVDGANFDPFRDYSFGISGIPDTAAESIVPCIDP